mgnify:CR=1 FL=1
MRGGLGIRQSNSEKLLTGLAVYSEHYLSTTIPGDLWVASVYLLTLNMPIHQRGTGKLLRLGGYT